MHMNVKLMLKYAATSIKLSLVIALSSFEPSLGLRRVKSRVGQRPVVQSIVSLTMSLRGHLVKYIPTTLSNTLLFFVGKM